MDIELDDIDRALITMLQLDGRQTYAQLGKSVGLSEGGARLRVLKLEERGILQVVGVTNPLRLGYERMAMLGVTVQGDARMVADRIGDIEGVIYLVLGTGAFDLIVEVLAATSDEMFSIINDRIRQISGVLSVQTFDYHAIHTHRFIWGPH